MAVKMLSQAWSAKATFLAAIADAEFGDKTESYIDASQELCILVYQTLCFESMTLLKITCSPAGDFNRTSQMLEVSHVLQCFTKLRSKISG